VRTSALHPRKKHATAHLLLSFHENHSGRARSGSTGSGRARRLSDGFAVLAFVLSRAKSLLVPPSSGVDL
jgi:hypothetical protein